MGVISEELTGSYSSSISALHIVAVGRGKRRKEAEGIACKTPRHIAETVPFVQKSGQNPANGPKFYALPRIRRIKNDLKKAGRAEYDIAVNAVLKMVGAHIGRKKRQEEQVLFAIGLGDFSANKNLASLHTSFGKYLTLKVMQHTSLVRLYYF